ncbi:DUF6252 family protein [Oceanihabitans sp. 2_MG-2023]|uniref:DUF6252 family protein n=1 Tax=Oceanihabitans sp. 2_MG-2023 TaxID=3062661 RepID=UPI0026E44213|nr:DUF6252 family protein [Oceanihabitans sp. 2_MG-2023]MDO6596110.1 DUF6252 family protein [Oceanihabitans sp. 2_MG-2023]
MRKLKQIMLFVMAVSLVTLTSCSNDDNGGSSGGGSGDEYLTAKVGGSNFSAAQDPSVIVGAQSTNGVLAVQGGDNSGNTISITLPNYNGVGTYVTGDSLTNQNGIQYLEISPALNSWASNFATAALGTLDSGTIEITSDDGTTVEGTFSFEGYNADAMTTKMITEGTFRANFD